MFIERIDQNLHFIAICFDQIANHNIKSMYAYKITHRWMIFSRPLGVKYKIVLIQERNGGPGGEAPWLDGRNRPRPEFFLHKMKAGIISFPTVGQTFQYVDK